MDEAELPPMRKADIPSDNIHVLWVATNFDGNREKDEVNSIRTLSASSSLSW